MKKRIFAGCLAVVLFAVAAVVGLGKAPACASDENITLQAVVNSPVVATDVKASGVLEARFLNMLNHNFVYDGGFYSLDSIVQGSVAALLDKRDAQNEDFIDEKLVADYIYNMYGIANIDFGEVAVDCPKLDGYVYIVPKGLDAFSHKIVSVAENEDGSYTVVTRVTVACHDGAETVKDCTSLFVRNENSAFGFNIICSNIESNTQML